MTGLKEFEQICKETEWKWELIEDEAAREAARIKFETLMAKYQALRLEVAASAPNSGKVSVVDIKRVEDAFRKYAPKGYMP